MIRRAKFGKTYPCIGNGNHLWQAWGQGAGFADLICDTFFQAVQHFTRLPWTRDLKVLSLTEYVGGEMRDTVQLHQDPPGCWTLHVNGRLQ